ncbi:MAG TPA: M24 family metallopeptidase [Thermodesulfobacteriota bacterium]|nr:M24 family metallopeptidase [Thermodesulfobacteriota bacterium]
MGADARAERVAAIQAALAEAGLDGWLFADFRGSDRIASTVLLLPGGTQTRRWYYFVPAAGRGAPRKLVHAIEPRRLEALPGETRIYASWQQLHAGLRELLAGARRVAMQYSPMNAIPYVARVDAGTVELVRSFGVEVVSSADLVQRFEAVWSAEEAASHRVAAEGCRATIDAAFAEVRRAIAAGRRLDEYGLQQFILAEFARRGLVTDHPPIVAVGPHSADPHYCPGPEGSAEIRPGDVLQLDIWARQAGERTVYADISWTAAVAREPSAEHVALFELVRRARDAAIALVAERVAAGRPVRGCEVDDAARAVIAAAGYGERFLHRTGHSIGRQVHGNGANLDNWETRDERQLLPGTGFSVEPGIYLEGRFGVRSEVNVYLEPAGADRPPRVVVTGQPVQTAVVALLA